jgi:hypothetical protein
MRQVLAVAAVVAAAVLVVAPPAGAGATKGPTLRSLQRQITSLQKQVKTLKKRVTDAGDIAVLGVAFGVCSTAVSADTFQDTYTGLNGYFAAHTGFAAYFGTQTPVNDYGACQALSIVRRHNQNPPTTTVMGSLLDLFRGSSLGTHQGFMDLTRQRGYLFSQLFVLQG